MCYANDCIRTLLLSMRKRGARISVLERRTQLIEGLDVPSESFALAGQNKEAKKDISYQEPEEN